MAEWFSKTDQVPLAAATGSAIMLGVFLLGSFLHSQHPQTFELLSQEDEVLEWTTFWAFIGAAAAFGLTILRQRAAGIRLPWFAWGLTAFCLFVAGEEISWGQRVVGYLPPEYFLAENYQQEFNLHNISSVELRTLVLEVILLGYGVVLPLAGLVPQIRLLCTRLHILIPPALIAPGFLLAYSIHKIYPWPSTGEWVECVMALGFLVTGVANATSTRMTTVDHGRPTRAVPKLVAAVIGAVSLGAAQSQIAHLLTASNPQLLAAARTELEALNTDFTSGNVMLKCDIHKRLYTFAREYDQTHLFTGAFAKLAHHGLPQTRQAYLLDPWNSPYWVLIECSGDWPIAFIYSFGPDRRRQSSDEAIIPDDIGISIGASK